MPRNTREWAKRKLDESKTNIKWSVYHLNEVECKYHEAHPEVSQPVEHIVEMLLEMYILIEKVRDSF